MTDQHAVWRWQKLVRAVAWALALVAFAASPALAQTPDAAAPKTKKKDRRGLVWDDTRPSIVFGKDINVDFRFKIQMDWRTFDPEQGVGDLGFPGTFDIETKRFGLKGELTKHFEYEIEHEIARPDIVLASDAAKSAKTDWKDVFIKWRTFDPLQIAVGRFKMPFGLEQNTGKSSTDFAYRTLASNTITPARDTGVLANGRFFGRGLTYELGVFQHDGDNGKLKEPQFLESGEKLDEPGPSFAGRVTAAILRPLGVPDALRGLRIGAAYTTSETPEGLNSFRGQSVFGTANFFDRVYVKGRRQRLGGELAWTPGPVGIKGEWMQSREARDNQGNRDQDLSDFLSTGWYASGTWILTGENKSDDIVPDKPLFQGGIGAFEIGARYDELSFASARHDGPAFQNPRSDNLIGSKAKTWTIGANWFVNKWVRVVLNGIHEEFDLNAADTPVNGTTSYWSAVSRLQIVF
jgi:phosphate-selective porin OprO/OprP